MAGTWQNALSEEITFPTNVVRFSRALSPHAIVDVKNDKGEIIGQEEVEQIVYYQPGVGTGAGDTWRGGIYGLGVSANIRAAYGFLAHNYDPGDKIFFFGFSRGAYTARSIAGLVNKLGLLTKQGMDYFPEVYAEFYNHPVLFPDFEFSDKLKKKLEGKFHEGAEDAVKIIGVWDTVGFHAEGRAGERIEFHSTMLSPKVEYAYHALALDERRLAFKPTLWQWPKDHVVDSRGRDLKDMRQVWFSGKHSDIGGGLYDSRLSDITLAWMIAQCSRDGKLAFNEDYLLDKTKNRNPDSWATGQGKTIEEPSASLLDISRSALADLFWQIKAEDRQPLETTNTYERIHRSIQERNLGEWPCGPLLDETPPQKKKEWPLKVRGKALEVTQEDDIEGTYCGRITPAPSQKRYSLVAGSSK
ncbi:hypothetical protein H2201_008997 [Coniosporium apollinis]|uniref:T6SS Phospholipase effector Tle1-like catalytic domain-containing protein n=1 Tax=Coniosporium apollinis TaxID=61459 RepID=A0ABQ9NHA8_9PEZI|nr:hypothetical protein H2201_008997 [Coniosporium apollinis]